MKNKHVNIDEIIDEFNPQEREGDVLGSYTGNPLFFGEPEQDADDL